MWKSLIWARIALTCLAIVGLSWGTASFASAAESARINSTLCQVEDTIEICQTVSGTYKFVETSSGSTVLAVHLVQEETIAYPDKTIYSRLEIDDQYVSRDGEPILVTISRLQQLELDDEVVSCTDAGRLVFAGGTVRLDPPATDC
jgi:hypothetical protein